MKLEKIKQLIQQDKLIRFYQSAAWRNKRLHILKKYNYECQECKRQGKVTSSKSLHVHHKKELKDYPELALLDSNLEPLCHECHNEHHDRLKDYKKAKPKFVNEERW